MEMMMAVDGGERSGEVVSELLSSVAHLSRHLSHVFVTFVPAGDCSSLCCVCRVLRCSVLCCSYVLTTVRDQEQ